VLPTIRRAYEEKWTFLDLGRAGISDEDWHLLDELFGLPELQYLSFGGYYFVEEESKYRETTNRGADNRFAVLPTHLTKLVNLNALALVRCNRVDSEGLKYLKDLQQLNSLILIACEKIDSEGLKYLKDLQQLNRLDLQGTAVKLNQEVIASADARQIFKWLLTDTKRPLDKFKLFLVGMGEAGKTHIRNRIKSDTDSTYTNHFEERTSCIEVHPVEVSLEAEDSASRTMTMLICDVGGQEKMHQTHRFYLGAERCCYALVLRADWPPEKNMLDYWLHFIANHSKTNEAKYRSSPVLILITQSDRVELASAGFDPSKFPGYQEWTSESVLSNYDQLKNELERVSREPNPYHGARVEAVIHGLGIDSELNSELPAGLAVRIQNQHNAALEELRQTLSRSVGKIPGIDEEFPPYFFAFQEWVGGALFDRRPYFDYAKDDEFQKMCQDNGLDRKQEQLTHLAILRSIGMIHFVGDNKMIQQSNYTEAQHWVFNPNWMHEPVYERILWGCNQLHQTGWLSTEDYRRIMSTERRRNGRLESNSVYDVTEQNAIRQLLQAMRIVFKVDNFRHNGMFIPDLLTNCRNTDRLVNDLGGTEQFASFKYNHLPERVFFAFLARHYADIPQDHRSECCFRNAIRFPARHPDNPTNNVQAAAIYEPYDLSTKTYQPRVKLFVDTSIEEQAAHEIRDGMKRELIDCCDEEAWNDYGEWERLDRRSSRAASDYVPQFPSTISNRTDETKKLVIGELTYFPETAQLHVKGHSRVDLKLGAMSTRLFEAIFRSITSGKFRKEITENRVTLYIAESDLTKKKYGNWPELGEKSSSSKRNYASDNNPVLSDIQISIGVKGNHFYITIPQSIFHGN